MAVKFNPVAVLLSLAPVIAVLAGQNAPLAQMSIAALALMMLAISLRGPDIDHIDRSLAGVRWSLLLIPLYLVLQLLPLPKPASHPIWASAGEAMPGASFGAVTVDRGDTLFALLSVLATAGLLIVTTAVARDRRRVEVLLGATAAVASIVAFAVFLLNFTDAFPALRSAIPTDGATLLSGFAAVSNAAILIATIDRFAAGRPAKRAGAGSLLLAFAGLTMGGAGLLRAGDPPQLIAVCLGLGCLAMLAVVRRFDLPALPAALLCVMAGIVWLVLEAWSADRNAAAVSLLLRSAAPAQVTPQLEAMVTEARWFGAGAGAFDDLAKLYCGADIAARPVAPSLAVTWSVELGRFGCALALVSGAAVLLKLVRAVFGRGRDWIYPAVAAISVALAATPLVLGTGLLNPAAAMVLMILLGIGLAQSYSH
ncbi:hypothetical protein [Rhodopseudomonas sp.]|uniref:hypothetical protein n=1 Tax=Rhodopseudomonas sp. TaxID=1078 RepID=UPI003B3AC70C